MGELCTHRIEDEVAGVRIRKDKRPELREGWWMGIWSSWALFSEDLEPPAKLSSGTDLHTEVGQVGGKREDELAQRRELLA